MRPVSDAFLQAVKNSHIRVVRVDVLANRETIAEGIPVIDGSVTLDRTASIRGISSLTLGGPGYVPTKALDLITPFGNELQIWRGVRLSTGVELVSLGIHEIGDINVDDLGGSIKVNGKDRSQLVTDADFETTYTVAAGQNYGTAIHDMIDAGVPGLVYRFAPVTAVTPLLVLTVDTPGARWANALSMATSCGCDLFFDGDGALVLNPIPDPRGDSAIDLHDGPGGVVIGAPKAWSRASSYNSVTTFSTNPAAGVTPVMGVARDLDPTSPTYYFGKFGKKPLRVGSEFLAGGDIDAAQNMADALLRQSLGVSQTLDLKVLPNPALEPGDLASVRRKSLGIDEVDVLDSLTIALDTSTAMDAGARARQVTH